MNNDWIELLESLAARRVEFLVVGAWAMAYHGQPRYTGDLDLFFKPSTENAVALIEALRAFGAPTGHLAVGELATSGTTVTFGAPPSRVDLLNWLSGLAYEDAGSDAEEAAGRPKDRLDAQILKADDDAWPR